LTGGVKKIFRQLIKGYINLLTTQAHDPKVSTCPPTSLAVNLVFEPCASLVIIFVSMIYPQFFLFSSSQTPKIAQFLVWSCYNKKDLHLSRKGES
jgi:hypothetical protein